MKKQAFYTDPKWRSYLAEKQGLKKASATNYKALPIVNALKRAVEKHQFGKREYRDRIYKAVSNLSRDRSVKLFFELEKDIESDIFWWWFAKAITASEFDEEYLSELPTIIERNDRLAGSFHDRQTAYEKYEVEYLEYFYKGKDFEAAPIREGKTIAPNLPNKVIAYKGFVTLDEERLKPTETDRERHSFHAVRRGWSFTLDPLRAEWFSWRFHKHALGFMKVHASDSNLLLPYLGRPTVGRYEVDREDILIFTDAWSEQEIIVDPSRAVLRDYDFLEGTDLFRYAVDGEVMASPRMVDREVAFFSFESWLKCRNEAGYQPKKSRYKTK